ncbi:hypothetical protein PHAMO_280014 [Magnetospirillum molischianum DSM 120]|uniref:Uncharacterized protein n=1 Tax=Magnetospirillum molischianum DSM 120 TaxID=1150626 RepID=H8FSZ2_MAGML|nr:hypothetical protein PHAMO_280014 [Magnetospirillum molischianum DSM 120]
MTSPFMATPLRDGGDETVAQYKGIFPAVTKRGAGSGDLPGHEKNPPPLGGRGLIRFDLRRRFPP